MSKLASFLALALFAATSSGCDSGSTTSTDSAKPKTDASSTAAGKTPAGKAGKIAKKSMEEKHPTAPPPPKTRGDL